MPAVRSTGATSVSDHSNFALEILLLLVVAGYASYWKVTKAKAMVQDWAQANHFRILHARLCLFPPRRIYWTTSEYRIVYQVSVYDVSSHNIRSGWVRLGTIVWGFMKPGAVDVIWDDADQAVPR